MGVDVGVGCGLVGGGGVGGGGGGGIDLKEEKCIVDLMKNVGVFQVEIDKVLGNYWNVCGGG